MAKKIKAKGLQVHQFDFFENDRPGAKVNSGHPSGASTSDLSAFLAVDRFESWRKIVDRFEADQTFVNAFEYVRHHPIFWRFRGAEMHEKDLIHQEGTSDLYMDVLKKKSGRYEVWLEAGPWTWSVSSNGVLSCQSSHDYQLDCGGNSYEQAIVRLARRIHKFYGNTRLKVDR